MSFFDKIANRVSDDGLALYSSAHFALSNLTSVIIKSVVCNFSFITGSESINDSPNWW